MEKFNYLEFLSTECKTEVATADFISQLMMHKIYEKGFKDAYEAYKVAMSKALCELATTQPDKEEYAYRKGFYDCENTAIKIFKKYCEEFNIEMEENTDDIHGQKGL